MQIYLNDKLATLKQDASFDFVCENRAFSGSDNYSLSITFPLRGCHENIEIFGHIYREDISPKELTFECEIRHNGFIRFGSLTITSANETEVTGQFLEGKAELNFSKILEETIISELDLGGPEILDASKFSPAEAWRANDTAVALPWVNNASGMLQNGATYSQGVYSWTDDTKLVGLSWMPYVLHLAKAICSAIGYSCDFSAWENSQWRWLLCCNVLPAAWDTPNFANALPAWTVGEFFDQLELLLDGEFEFDYRSKFVSFQFTDEILKIIPEESIENITRELSREIQAESPECDYERERNLTYSSSNFDLWNFYSCQWFIDNKASSAIVYETLDELLAYLKTKRNTSGRPYYGGYLPGGGGANIRHLPSSKSASQTEDPRFKPREEFFYCKDVNCFYVLHTLRKTLITEYENEPNLYELDQELLSVNAFGPRLADSHTKEETQTSAIELKIVPVGLDDTDETFGRCAFLPFSATDYGTPASSVRSKGIIGAEERKKAQDEAIPQVRTFSMIKAGENSQQAELYSQIFVGFWNGVSAQPERLPHPIIESPTISQDLDRFVFPFSLRLNNRNPEQSAMQPIKPTQKVQFNFLADKIPNPRAVFFIRGKRYICEKITATFSDTGMSQLLKGEFYPIRE